jgi:hypothetical protein
LADVRREVVGFAAARVLHHSDDIESSIDGPTTYYLLHRNDFGLAPIPVGASILYAISCNLRDTTLIDEYDLLSRPGRALKIDPDLSDELEDQTINDLDVPNAAEARSAKADKSLVQLKPWNDRKRPSLGEDVIGHPAPLIDQVHRLMRLWKSGDVSKVNDYIAARGLSSDRRAREVIQAIIELAERATEERSILEGISNHLGDARPAAEAAPALLSEVDSVIKPAAARPKRCPVIRSDSWLSCKSRQRMNTTSTPCLKPACKVVVGAIDHRSRHRACASRHTYPAVRIRTSC